MKTYISPSSECDDRPQNNAMLRLHISDLSRLEICVSHFCRTAPNHFDCSPHSHEYRDIVKLLRSAIEGADPEYAKMMFDKVSEEQKWKPSPGTIAREIHHHYHPYPTPRLSPKRTIM